MNTLGCEIPDTVLVNTEFMHNLENLENKPFFEKLRENPQIS